MPAPLINSLETPKSQETVVKHSRFLEEKQLEKTTDYTPTTVTISGRNTRVYVFDYHPDTPALGA